MGCLRFIVSPADRVPEPLAQYAYLWGPDRIPWKTRVRWSQGELWLERSVSESGALSIPWPVEGRGLITLSTGTLSEGPQPYHLPLELARGKVGQVRNQQAEWELMGIQTPEAAAEKCTQAVRLLSKAAVGERGSARAAELAEQCLRVAVRAGEILVQGYTEQALASRRRQSPRLPVLFGAELGSSAFSAEAGARYLETFNAALVPMLWREIEATEGGYFWDLCDRQVAWCRTHGLAICAGPLLRFDARSIPDWLHLCDGDFESLLSFASEFIEAVVRRYRGQVEVWLAAGGMNTAELLSLNEEEKIRLTAQAIELARSCDPDAQVFVSFDQPWGEYLGRKEQDFPPLHFADVLLRAGLGLTGLELQINLGYSCETTLPRDLLDFSQGLDYWSCLEVPLLVRLGVPSASVPDPLAQRRGALPAEDFTPASQRTWIARYVPLLLAKPAVQGVFWGQLCDSEPHEYPHAGLFDLRRHPKPALRQLASIRRAYLK
ncbi:MAG: endo-1,4-beta-xylanase [Thermoguttaceae bacterium]